MVRAQRNGASWKRSTVLALALLTAPMVTAQTPSLSIEGASALEGDAGTSELLFRLLRSGDTSDNIAAIVTTGEPLLLPATPDSDYERLGLVTLLLPPGSDHVDIPIRIKGDTLFETDENVLLGVAYAANIGPTPAVGASVASFAGTAPKAAATADFNGDGRVDLVFANALSDDFTVRLNTTVAGAANASFAAPTSTPVGGSPVAVAVGDFNFDGRPDVAIVSQRTSELSVWVNTTPRGAATVSFSDATRIVTGVGASAVAAADFNGDGRSDLAVANTASRNVVILLSLSPPGAIALSFSVSTFAITGTPPADLMGGDFNADGRPDLLTSGGQGLTNYTPAGANQAMFYAFATTNLAGKLIAAGDFNNDGLTDVFVQGDASGYGTVMLNRTEPGALFFIFVGQPYLPLLDGKLLGGVAQDVNLDGRVDLIVVREDANDVRLRLNITAVNLTSQPLTSAFFSDPITLWQGTDPRFIAAADFNGDAKPDFAVTEAATDVVLLANSTVTPALPARFAAATSADAGPGPRAVMLADLNGDRVVDVAYANPSTNSVTAKLSYYLYVTPPGFPPFAVTTSYTLPVGAGPRSMIASDFNGDGKEDMAVTNRNGDSVSVILSAAPLTMPNGNITFAPSVAFAVGDAPDGLCAADFDRDGRPDIAVANEGSGEVSLLLNRIVRRTDVATFTPAAPLNVAGSASGVASADFDGDALPDLAITNATSRTVSVLLNTSALAGAGIAFGPPLVLSTGTAPRAPAIGDLNGDGRRDLVVANTGDGSLSIFLNATAPGATTASFGTETRITGLGTPRQVVLSDINADGRLDLSVPAGAGGVVNVLVNRTPAGASTPVFDAPVALIAGSGELSIASADVSLDRQADLVTVDALGGTLSILRNRVYELASTTVSALGVIRNDDALLPTPELSIGDVRQAEGSTEFHAFVFTVTLSSALNAPVTVDYATANGGALDREDYLAASGTLRFEPFQTTAQIVVNVRGDQDYEPDESFFVDLSNPAGTTIADARGEAVIVNDDDPPRLSIADASGDEGSSTLSYLVFNVTRSGNLAAAASVHYRAQDGSASVLDTDYLPTEGTLTFQPNQATAAFSVLIGADRRFEPDETFTVVLSDPGGAIIDDASATGTIVNDDRLPGFAIRYVDTFQFEGDEGNTGFVFNISRFGELGESSTVEYATVDGTASAADNDFVPASGTLTFAPGQDFASIVVPVKGDRRYEENETFSVILRNPVRADLYEGSATATIRGDDLQATFSLDAVTQVEGNTGSTLFSFMLTRSGDATQAATLRFFTFDGTATAADDDYAPVDQLVTLAPGELSRVLTVPVVPDRRNEDDEYFYVRAVGTTSSAALATIVNDDSPPNLSVADIIRDEADAGVTLFTFTVTRAGDLTRPASVDFATADGTATIVDGDYVAASGRLQFSPGQSSQVFTVQVNGDARFENDEQFNVVLSNPTEAILSRPSASGTIRDDDFERSGNSGGGGGGGGGGSLGLPGLLVLMGMAGLRRVRAWRW